MSNASLLILYQAFKSNFSDSAQRADQRHLRMWENIDDSVYCWFESLAEEMNADMRGGQQHQTHAAIFDFFRQQFMLGDESVKNCIEVAWLEHLFWQVPAKLAASDWHTLPSVFKQLYVSFHQKSPVKPSSS